MAMSATLPEGFVLNPVKQVNGLPEGFVLDAPSSEPQQSPSLIDQGLDFFGNTASTLINTAQAIPGQVAGAVEPVLAIGSGVVADTVGNIGGGIQQALNPNNPVAGTQARDRIQDSLTFRPRSEAGQRVMQRFGEVLEPVNQLIEKSRLGDEVLESGGSETLARLAEGIPDFVGAALAPFGARQPRPALKKLNVADTGRIEPEIGAAGKVKEFITKGDEKGQIKSNIVNKTGDASTATSKLDHAGNVVNDPIGADAVKQGMSEPIVAMIKNVSPKEKFNYRKMIRAVQGKLQNAGQKARPSDVVGDSFMERVQRLQKVAKHSGGLVPRVANTLKGKTLDASGPTGIFRDKVSELGGKLSDEGKLQFDIDSQLFGQAGQQSALRTVMAKVDNLGQKPDAFKVHELKQFIDSLVSYGKTKQSGLSGRPEAILKELRHDLNDSLKGSSTKYDKVNTAYSDAVDALTDFQGVAGNKMDLFGPNADRATGTLMRRLLGNAVSRVPLEDAILKLEGVATKYGGKYSDNMDTQMKFINELERMFGPSTESSFKAEIGQGIERGVESLSLAQGATSLTRSAINAARGKSQANAFKAIERLINVRTNP